MGRTSFVFGSNGSDMFEKLKFAESDTERIASVLAGSRYQFNVIRPLSMDPYEIRRKLDTAAGACGRDDTFICYFAGHGVLDEGELFLIVENSAKDLASTAVPAEAVTAALRPMQGSRQTVDFGLLSRGWRRRIASWRRHPGRGASIIVGKSPVLMASGRLERTRELESLQAGILTAGLISAMERNFHDADTDHDLNLTLDDIMVWLNEWTSGGMNENPIPRLFGEKKGTFLLTAPLAARTAHELLWADGSNLVFLQCAPVQPLGDFFESRRLGWIKSRPHRANEPGYALAIGKYPVTNGQYRDFVKAQKPRGAGEPTGLGFDGKAWKKGFRPWSDALFAADDLPVTCVSFSDAVKYCDWAASLKRNTGSFVDVQPFRFRDFAAFDTEFPNEDPAGWRDNVVVRVQRQMSPTPVNSPEAGGSRHNVSHLFGNVWEWCGTTFGMLRRRALNSENFANAYKLQRPHRNWNENVRLRGGSYLTDLGKSIPFLPSDKLESGIETRRCDIGFRVAAMVPTEELPEAIVQNLSLCRPLNLSHSIEQLSQINEWADFDF
jgi:formylglycine-generating enzyme required for sulfatase activity